MHHNTRDCRAVSRNHLKASADASDPTFSLFSISSLCPQVSRATRVENERLGMVRPQSGQSTLPAPVKTAGHLTADLPVPTPRGAAAFQRAAARAQSGAFLSRAQKRQKVSVEASSRPAPVRLSRPRESRLIYVLLCRSSVSLGSASRHPRTHLTLTRANSLQLLTALPPLLLLFFCFFAQALASLIELDVMHFELLELQPLSEYELYIRTYGKKGCAQASVQSANEL